MTSRKQNQSNDLRMDHESLDVSEESIDVFQLPPRKEVHSKPKRKEAEKEIKEDNHENQVLETREEKQNGKKNSRIYRREKKKEKTARKWNIYLLRFIVILFILTLIAIPLYYTGGFINDKDINKVNPVGEEIRFQ